MKILEFMRADCLCPSGGPIGYLHALYQEDCKNGKKINFLGEDSDVNDGDIWINKSEFRKKIRLNLMYIKTILFGKRSTEIEENNYDIIHFHSTFDLFKHRKSLKYYNGIVVLTSHAPILASKEIYNEAHLWEKVLFFISLKALFVMDIYSFTRADKIIFPCREAEEPYYHSWYKFSQIKEKYYEKFEYVPTGTFQREARISREDIRKKYNIPNEAFVVCYVGRHNKIKGYDTIKDLAQSLLKYDKSVYFLIAGKEQPIKGLNNKNWIEVGWTNDPHSIIGASDLFILPNKETYFDLVLLEVLSLGKIILATRTGGNKYFDSNEYPGVILYQDNQQAMKKIAEIKAMPLDEKESLENTNKIQFKKQFDVSVFYSKYMDLMNRIYVERKKTNE